MYKNHGALSNKNRPILSKDARLPTFFRTFMSHHLRPLRYILVDDDAASNDSDTDSSNNDDTDTDTSESGSESSDDSDAADGQQHVPCGWHAEWPDLEVRQSEQGHGSGLGVFSTRTLHPWECLPIYGRPLTPDRYDDLRAQHLVTHVSFTRDGRVDGHPRHRPWQGVGGRGLYLSSLVNEPRRKKPNMVMRGSNLVVAQPIAAGDELLVSYGPRYTRDYPVSRYALTKQHYAALER